MTNVDWLAAIASLRGATLEISFCLWCTICKSSTQEDQKEARKNAPMGRHQNYQAIIGGH
jgi:hypothetical protein